jgi:hypothetical protein
VIVPLMFLLLAAPSAQEMRLHHVLDRVADRCHLSRRVFRVDRGGDIHLNPPSSAPYRDVDCALVQLRKRGLWKNLPFAFVGNESNDPSEQP